jgi:hypothetical protein
MCSRARRTSLRQTSGSIEGIPSDTASVMCPVPWPLPCGRFSVTAAWSRFSTGRMFGSASAGRNDDRTVA